jgi:hypothetical protein
LKLGTHTMRRNGGASYQCPVCKTAFDEKIMLAIQIGRKH